MKNSILLSCIVFLSAVFISCKESSVAPKSVIKTPREMTWTCDTLVSPDSTSIQLLMNKIVAFSSSDVWICGWCDVARGLIWHYDGKTWKESNIFQDVGGMRISDLAGSSSNDLWAGGFRANSFGPKVYFAHYNGTRWETYPDMGIKGEIIDMTKDREGNLWACARNGVVFKYSQGKWMADTVDIFHHTEADYFLSSIALYKGRPYVTGIITDVSRHQEINYFATFEMGKSWSILDSSLIDNPYSQVRFGKYTLYTSSFSKLYSTGLVGMWQYDDNSGWNTLQKYDGTIWAISDIGQDYMIAVGDFKKALFFDGSRWTDIGDLFPQADRYFLFRNVWTNGYETFIIGYTMTGQTKTLVWHGK